MSGSDEASVDRLCELCSSLQSVLEEAGMLDRSRERRSATLRTLFRLIDLDSARLSLRVAELCLAVSLPVQVWARGRRLLLLSHSPAGSWVEVRGPKYRNSKKRSSCSWLSLETTCSTSVDSSTRLAALKSTMPSSRKIPSLVNTVLGLLMWPLADLDFSTGRYRFCFFSCPLLESIKSSVKIG